MGYIGGITHLLTIYQVPGTSKSCSKIFHLPLDLWISFDAGGAIQSQPQPGAPKAPKGDMPPKKPPIEPSKKLWGIFFKMNMGITETCHVLVFFFAFLSFLQKTKEWQRGTSVGNTVLISQEKAGKSDLFYAK